MYEIESADTRKQPCPCCGAEQTLLTYFISVGDAPFAILQAALPEGRHAGKVDALLTLGYWSDDPSLTDVAGFPFTLVRSCDELQTKSVGRAETSWSSSWGPCLEPGDAVNHPRFSQALEVIKAVFRRDDALSAYLRAQQRT